MNDEEVPSIHVEVNMTDIAGHTILFSDYQSGDAPLLIVNTLSNQSISFSQKEDS